VRGGGTIGDALAMFDAATSYANDLGLMAEEVNVRTGRALGNFPQAYTHVGVISSALSIAERLPATPRVSARQEMRP
ncbi:MAG TPA: glycoside hydrolase family 15 protein, partial [Kofleriaceae bacterium]|nr:glycoside hydrolase family 15 protein [Kofleriaceae bacterium]